MKSVIKTFATLMVAAVAACATANAQEGRQRMTREQLAEVQAKHIAKEVSMDEATTEKFVKTYCQFQTELWALNPKPERQPKEEMTDDEIKQQIEQGFEHSQKILDLRKKYYQTYSEFLTPKQIQSVYRKERQMMNRLSQRGKMRPGEGSRPMPRKKDEKK